MLFNMPVFVLGIFGLFFVLGLFSLVFGVAWTRRGERVEGAPARLSGFAVLVMGTLITLAAMHPDLDSVIMPLICLWPLSAGLAGRILLDRQADSFDRLPRIPLERRRKPKPKRKRGEW